MKSLDAVVLDPEFVGGTISHQQLKECNHKGQHLLEDCGLDHSSITGAQPVPPEVPDETQTKSSNPKDVLAREEQRVPLHLIPPPGLVHTALAMGDGARKYGPFNFRDEGVGASTYVGAAMRHILAWLDGEECAPDSGTHHLGHAAACLMILMDAQAVGNLVDDRPAPAPTAEMMEEVKREGKAEDAHWLNLPDYEPDYSCLEEQEDEGREEYGPGGCAV